MILKFLKQSTQKPCFLLFVIVIVMFSCGCKKFIPGLNETPDAKFEFDQNGLEIRFNASESYDDGEIIDYKWNFGDGTIGEGVETFHSYEEEGKYFVELTVTDDDEAYDTVTKEIDLYLVNTIPTAILKINAVEEPVDFEWKFDGSDSYDSDGDGYIINYKFQIIRLSDGKEEDVVDTIEGRQNIIPYVFKKDVLQGQDSVFFKIKLIVKDNRGDLSPSASETIKVNE